MFLSVLGTIVPIESGRNDVWVGRLLRYFGCQGTSEAATQQSQTPTMGPITQCPEIISIKTVYIYIKIMKD